MEPIITFPRICIVCDQKTDNYLSVENEISPEDPQEYICSNCIELVEKISEINKKNSHNEKILARRNSLKIIE